MAIEIRPVLGYADLERWVSVRNEVVADDPVSAQRMALVRASEHDRLDVLALDGGEPVGAGMVAGDPNSLQSSHPHVEVTVPERHRGRGVGSALLAAVSAHVRALGKDGIHCDARQHDAYAVAFLERRGFVEVGRMPLLGVELERAETAEPRLPAGVELTWLAARPDLLDGMYAVAAATYPEIGGHIAKEAGSLHEWQLYELGDPLVRFDMTPIAIAGEQVVGFATMVQLPDGAAAAHRITAVLPGWRRQGIGTALTRAQLTEARKAGLRMLMVWQRTELVRYHHDRLGYEEQAVSIDFRGPLQDATG